MRPGIEIRMTTKEFQLLEKILMDYGMKRTKKETWEWLRLFHLGRKKQQHLTSIKEVCQLVLFQ